MFPELFGIDLYVAGTVLGYALGVIIGVWLGLKDRRSFRDLIEVGAVICIAGVLGAKVFHTLFEAKGHRLPDGTIAEGLADLLRADPWHWARLFEPGYVYYGGVIFGIGFAYLFLRRGGFERLGAFGDYAAPGFALGIFVGRLGCFAAGCCYGRPTALPFAVTFPAGHELAGIPIHPVQIYDAVFGLAAFFLTIIFYGKRRFPGESFALLIASYTVWRFVTETFRADADRGVWFSGWLSTSQLVSLVVLPITMLIWWRERNRALGSGEAGVSS